MTSAFVPRVESAWFSYFLKAHHPFYKPLVFTIITLHPYDERFGDGEGEYPGGHDEQAWNTYMNFKKGALEPFRNSFPNAKSRDKEITDIAVKPIKKGDEWQRERAESRAESRAASRMSNRPDSRMSDL